MTILEIIFRIIYIIAGALSVGIPLLIKFVNSLKKLKNAQTEVEKEKAKSELKEEAKNLIQAAEIAYKEVNAVLKAKGSSAGSIKKDSVMTKLENYAIERDIAFDKEYWSTEIDELVKFSKGIN